MATNQTNAFETTLRLDMGSTDLVAAVQSTDGSPASPCYLVIEPTNADRREYILFDGTFTADQFVTSTTANRYLMPGSAATSGLLHPAGSVVRFAPVAQHFTDLSSDITGAVSDHVTARHANSAKIASGSYAGDDTVGRTIALPFTPTWVAVSTDDLPTTSVNYFLSAITTGSTRAVSISGDGTTINRNTPRPTTNGFVVGSSNDNLNGNTYRYVAFG